MKEIDEALKYQPYNKNFYINKGTFYTNQGQHDQAIRLYYQALRLAPKMPQVYLNLAANYFTLKDYQKTVDMLNRVDLTPYPEMAEMKRQAESMLGQQK